MRDRFRFSVRGLLALNAITASVTAVGLSWPSRGSQIGPSLFVLSLVLSAAIYRYRHTAWGGFVFRTAVVTLLCITLLYASFGPSSWAMARFNTPNSRYPLAYEAYSYIYCPIATNVIFAPEPLRSAAISYTEWWMPSNAQFHDWGNGIGWSVPGWTYTVIHY